MIQTDSLPWSLRPILLLAMFLALSSCRYSPPRSERIEDYPDLMRGKVVELALALVGRPYRLGGGEIDGLDCSGFVRYVFHAFGYEAPRTAARYGRLKPKLSLSSAKRADVLVFKQKGTWHLGLVVGDNRFVHAPSRGQRVREEAVTAYWRDRLVRVVRIIAD